MRNKVLKIKQGKGYDFKTILSFSYFVTFFFYYYLVTCTLMYISEVSIHSCRGKKKILEFSVFACKGNCTL